MSHVVVYIYILVSIQKLPPEEVMLDYFCLKIFSLYTCTSNIFGKIFHYILRHFLLYFTEI